MTPLWVGVVEGGDGGVAGWTFDTSFYSHLVGWWSRKMVNPGIFSFSTFFFWIFMDKYQVPVYIHTCTCISTLIVTKCIVMICFKRFLWSTARNFRMHHKQRKTMYNVSHFIQSCLLSLDISNPICCCFFLFINPAYLCSKMYIMWVNTCIDYENEVSLQSNYLNRILSLI